MKYFTQRDFERCSPSCKTSDMHPEFMRKLDHARELSGIPFVLTSAYRTVEHELPKGRNGLSTHTKGRAVDIVADTSRKRYVIVQALMQSGITRIGINFDQGFIHADDDPDKSEALIFGY